MTVGQSEAVLNLRQRILDSPGRTVLAGKTRIAVPEVGFTQRELDKRLVAYADRLVKQRALTIAITEPAIASNEGQRQLWAQAVNKGLLNGTENREWIVTDPCPLCAPLDGALAPIDGTFPGGFKNPPRHPRCQCTQGLRL